ncbi:MAG: hypothetical protein H0V29_09805 [Thermoleophilaceae bacterium]|nr:hypothetical protein [Thermoleophilaceae bacterium]
MTILLRIVAVVFVLIALFLIYAVINAFASDEGARIGIVILYIPIAAALAFLASKLWGGRKESPPPAV